MVYIVTIAGSYFAEENDLSVFLFVVFLLLNTCNGYYITNNWL